MENSLELLKKIIIEQLRTCQDADLLDLVLKLLIHESS